MTREQTQSRWRMTVLSNYLAVLLGVILPLLAKATGSPWGWIVVFVVLVVTISITFRKAFKSTGLWTLTHAKPSTLDERELEQTHAALGVSYRWMLVVMIATMYLLILARQGSLGQWLGWVDSIASVLAMAFLYVAHTLPAAIIGWNQLPPANDATNDAAVAR
ncbi:hypothetical protein KQI52_11385 [bacterium]|nr:hypothetical protein [bacterium]